MDTTQFTGPSEIEVPVEYNTRDLILYALGIGSKDHRFVYENHEEFAAFPTYAIVLMFKGNSFNTLPFPPPSLTSFPTPPLSSVKAGLDAEKKIERLAELPKDGAALRLVGRVCGIHKKGPGALVEREYKLVDEAGKIYYKMIDAAMLVGAKDFQDSGITHSRNNPPPKDVQPTHVFHEKTDEDQPLTYRLSGDYNPLHIDSMISKMMGFEKPIMHGQCTMGIVCRVLLEKLANSDQRRYKCISVRFASPVLPGDTLAIEVWQKSSTEFIFQVKVESTGKVCVSNGLFELHSEAKL